MLEKGEFVVRKEVAKEFLPELQGLNWYGLNLGKSLFFGEHLPGLTGMNNGDKLLQGGENNEYDRNSRKVHGSSGEWTSNESTTITPRNDGRGNKGTHGEILGLADREIQGLGGGLVDEGRNGIRQIYSRQTIGDNNSKGRTVARTGDVKYFDLGGILRMIEETERDATPSTIIKYDRLPPHKHGVMPGVFATDPIRREEKIQYLVQTLHSRTKLCKLVANVC